MTFAEFADLDTLSTKKEEEILQNLHIIASIMFRPITEEVSKHDYQIEKYDVKTMKKRAELFKEKLDIKFVLGAQFFFIKFAKKYSNYTPQYLVTKMSFWMMIRIIWTFWRMRYKIPSNKRSDGFWSSTKLLTTILQNTNTSTRKT